MLNKALIQLSVDWWGCTPSQEVVWPEATQPWGLESLCQEGPSWPAPASVPVVRSCRPRPPQETLQHERVVLVQSPVGLLPLSFGRPIIKSCRPSRPDSLGFPVPLSDPQAGKPAVRFRTFTMVQELLWYYCFPICGSPTRWVQDLILS